MRTYTLTRIGIILIVASMVASCGRNDTPPIGSPSGEYSVFASIEEGGIVYVNLSNTNDVVLHSVRSGAGDFSRWALGWMHDSDFVVLYSSDIGTRGYEIDEGKLIEVSYTQLSTEVHRRADALYYQKYDSPSPTSDDR